MPARLADPLTLPCGLVLKNRISKAAMTEGIADARNCATGEHVRLYERWADGGAGLLITGNILVDRRFLERPGNVVIDANGGFDRLSAFAEAGKRNGAHVWVQINHPGRQAGTGLEQLVAPSESSLIGKEGTARALEASEIDDVLRRFLEAAKVAEETGFTGVQVHAAHGYLLSQFLSPLTNRREDEWGGPLENRARLLLDIVRGIRAERGAGFAVSVKLNSADFQRGGLTEDESIEVTKWLCEAGIDLLEISGGNYESQSMIGRDEEGRAVSKKSASTLAREAYFIDFAARLGPLVDVPLMVTGGFRTKSAMEEALANDQLDVIGLARPLCIDPSFPDKLLSGEIETLPSPENDISIDEAALGGVDETMRRIMEVQASMAYYFNQIRKLAAGEGADEEIDWFEQLGRHADFDARADERYLAAS
ncbi:NADH:flavin oxidoreductase/NADH oxidase family protein [Parasphingopyxis marina]|uniref:NADH:flavin oxidoreductase/NADH oxidase family protein n=1 Tax=Parasphingopyxis marina TaxID=2761622 RepID=A0A842I3J5_9SPHN|nr:NADH:flavin oxidoreductase/NADH oxidase family protein [Parasphingopyxis marina]MBC2778990.1 NADH:flavin oxidoreductase/NADH oxidase family protein [Parasphingopyxis marina]